MHGLLNWHIRKQSKSMQSDKLDPQLIIKTFLSDQLGTEVELNDEQTLESLGVDSIMLLELIFEFEEKLNIDFSDDIPQPKTVGELMITVNALYQSVLEKS